MGELTATHMAHYTSLVEVAAALTGKADKNGAPRKGPYTEDLSKASPEAFQARVTQMLGGG